MRCIILVALTAILAVSQAHAQQLSPGTVCFGTYTTPAKNPKVPEDNRGAILLAHDGQELAILTKPGDLGFAMKTPPESIGDWSRQGPSRLFWANDHFTFMFESARPGRKTWLVYGSLTPAANGAWQVSLHPDGLGTATGTVSCSQSPLFKAAMGK